MTCLYGFVGIYFSSVTDFTKSVGPISSKLGRKVPWVKSPRLFFILAKMAKVCFVFRPRNIWVIIDAPHPACCKRLPSGVWRVVGYK